MACAGKEVPVQVDGMAYLSIYSFERALDGVGWTTSGWAFDPPSRTELTTMLGAAALAGVSRVVLTYPVFIATDEFILFTIQAQNDSGYAFSRVFLVDRTATTDRFLDLTAAIEDHIGVARAEYRSIYGCGVAV